MSCWRNFQKIFERNYWRSSQEHSGGIREEIPDGIDEYFQQQILLEFLEEPTEQ